MAIEPLKLPTPIPLTVSPSVARGLMAIEPLKPAMAGPLAYPGGRLQED